MMTGHPLILTVLPSEDNQSLRCPDESCGGTVVEVDEAIRWNPLSLVIPADGSARYLWTHTSGDSSWERRDPDGFICDTCLRTVVFAEAISALADDITYD